MSLAGADGDTRWLVHAAVLLGNQSTQLCPLASDGMTYEPSEEMRALPQPCRDGAAFHVCSVTRTGSAPRQDDPHRAEATAMSAAAWRMRSPRRWSVALRALRLGRPLARLYTARSWPPGLTGSPAVGVGRHSWSRTNAVGFVVHAVGAACHSKNWQRNGGCPSAP